VQLQSAEALDALLLEQRAAWDSLDGSSFGRKQKQANASLQPTDVEIERVAEIFFSNPALRRLDMADSSLKVEGRFVITADHELDFPTFSKLIALVQRPEKGQKAHTAAQQKGWRTAFELIDADGAGIISPEKLERYLERRKRAVFEAARTHVKHVKEQEGANTDSIATDLQQRVQTHVRQKRSKAAAIAAIDEAVVAGAPLEAFFPLAMALAPALYDCQRASLWLVRPTASAVAAIQQGSGDDDNDGVAKHLDLWERAWCGELGSRQMFTRLDAGGEYGECWATTVAQNKTPPTYEEIQRASLHADKDEVALPINNLSIAGSAVTAMEPQMVADARHDTRFDHTWDEKTGFTTQAVLCIPLFGDDRAVTEEQAWEARRRGVAAVAKQRCIGCLQLINKLSSTKLPTAKAAVFEWKDVRFGEDFCSRLVTAIEGSLPRMLSGLAEERERAATARDRKQLKSERKARIRAMRGANRRKRKTDHMRSDH
jgi:hypothetical protein